MALNVEQLLQAALAHHQAGRLAEAEQIYREAASLDPQNSDALHLLGFVLHQRGQSQDGLTLIRQALSLNPGQPEFHVNLGLVLEGLNRPEEAEQSYRRALALDRNMPEAHLHLAGFLARRARLVEAADHYRKTIELAPDDAAAYVNLAGVLDRMGHVQRAAMVLEQAIKRLPNLAEAHASLALLLEKSGLADAAIQSGRLAVALAPELAQAHHALGAVMVGNGRVNEAVDFFHHATVLDRNDRTAASSLLLAMQYLPSTTQRQIYEAHADWGRQYARLQRFQHDKHDRSPERRLRIGYVSPDFRRHAVASFIEGILLNPAQDVEVFCYSSSTQPDDVTARLQTYAVKWRDIAGLNDGQAAELIRADGIDILLELSGHTSGNRLLLLARKPAPVQCTWIGYPDTTGVEAIDYRLSDAIVDPDPSQFTVERIRHIGSGFSCFKLPEDLPRVNDLPADSANHITFGSLHGLPKINAETIRLWSSVLHAVKNSRLLMVRNNLIGQAQRRLLEQFAIDGVADRVELSSDLPVKGYLHVYHRVDVALDALPWSGHTTACEAMCMGVPTITRLGETRAGRMVASALHQIGRDDWVARSREQFISIAESLCHDFNRLRQMRRELREAMRASLLSDATAFSADYHGVLRQLWRDFCRGRGLT